MTDCPNGEIRDLLPDLLHQRLAPAERERVQAHVDACADCRAELALLGGLRAAMHRAPAVDVGAIVAAIPAYRAPAKRSWGGWRIAAAVTMIAVGGTSVAVMQSGVPDSADTIAVAASPATAAAASTAAGVIAEPLASAAAVSPTSHPTAAAAPRELAMGGGSMGDLSEQELAALLKDVRSMDVIPSATVEVEPSLSPSGVQP